MRSADRIEGGDGATAQLFGARHEIFGTIVDVARTERGDECRLPARRCADHAELCEPRELQQRCADAARRAVHEDRVAF